MKRGSALPEFKSPHQSMAICHPYLMPHTEACESITSGRGTTVKCSWSIMLAQGATLKRRSHLPHLQRKLRGHAEVSINPTRLMDSHISFSPLGLGQRSPTL